MSDGRAAVLCLLCSLDLFILFWFSVCFGYIVYSYISPSLFLSCSFASFCSPSKFHKVSFFLFFLLLLTPRGRSPQGAASTQPGQSRLGFALAVRVCVSACLCVCSVAAHPWGRVLHPALQCPWGCPMGTLGAGQGPVSASRAPRGHPLHELSLCTDWFLFLPGSYLQWFTEEMQFRANSIKSAILCKDAQTNLILILELPALQSCTLTILQAS